MAAPAEELAAPTAKKQIASKDNADKNEKNNSAELLKKTCQVLKQIAVFNGKKAAVLNRIRNEEKWIA